MKILVLGGMHGNELLGVGLVRSLQASPIPGVDACIANPRAVEQGVRYTETDLNRSFGKQAESNYETRRAEELSEIVKDYDLVLDFHNTQTPGNNCAFIGTDASPLLYDVAKSLGYDQLIQATYDCINKYSPSTISMEISVGDAWDDVGVWRRKITRLARSPLRTDRPLAVYRFLQRVTWAEAEKLPNAKTWQPFIGIADADKTILKVDGQIVPIFIGSHLTEYYATLLERMK